jgi:hypothetical protein
MKRSTVMCVCVCVCVMSRDISVSKVAMCALHNENSIICRRFEKFSIYNHIRDGSTPQISSAALQYTVLI